MADISSNIDYWYEDDVLKIKISSLSGILSTYFEHNKLSHYDVECNNVLVDYIIKLLKHGEKDKQKES